MGNTRPRPTVTHTVAELAVSSATYNEIAALLRAAEYDHAFGADGMIDMGGIGLTDNGVAVLVGHDKIVACDCTTVCSPRPGVKQLCSRAAGFDGAPTNAGYDPRASLEIDWDALRGYQRAPSAPDDPGPGGDDGCSNREGDQHARVRWPAILIAVAAAIALVVLVRVIGQDALGRGLALFFHLN